MSYSDYNTAKHFKGDIIITDPCYIIKQDNEDWKKCDYGRDMNKLGIKNYLCGSTIYGDWSCVTIDNKNNEKIGSFCADAGLVAVFLLDEVLKYNPNFNYHKEKPWTTTLIKDFDGYISINVKTINSEDEVFVVGKGNIDFHTTQIGF